MEKFKDKGWELVKKKLDTYAFIINNMNKARIRPVDACSYMAKEVRNE